MIDLHERENDGLIVTLAWDKSTNKTYLAVLDLRTETDEIVEIDPADCLAAFEHPFPYLHKAQHNDIATTKCPNFATFDQSWPKPTTMQLNA